MLYYYTILQYFILYYNILYNILYYFTTTLLYYYTVTTIIYDYTLRLYSTAILYDYMNIRYDTIRYDTILHYDIAVRRRPERLVRERRSQQTGAPQ
jgi:hypothetical protein